MEPSEKPCVGGIVGLVVTFVGMALRANARALAWPTEYSYSGSRESTIWAFREGMFADFAQALTLLGCGLLVVTFYRWLSMTAQNERQ